MSNFYRFEISSSGCNYKLWLNDIRVDIQMENHPVVYDLPVNQWIKNGVNLLSCELLPLFNNPELSQRAYFRMKVVEGIVAAENFLPSKEIKAIQTPDFKDLKETNPETKLNKYLLADSFTASVPFTNNLFHKLTPVAPDFYEMAELYRGLHSLFYKKDKTALLSLMDFKIKEYSQAYYKSFETELARQSNFLDMLFRKKLEPLDMDSFKVFVFLNSTLACLEDEEGDQPISFTDSSDYTTFYPVYFGKKEGDQNWIVAL